MRTCRILVLALLGALLSLPVPAYADCADLSAQQRVDRADAVFVGTVVGAASSTVQVRVTDVYKGPVDAIVRVDGGDPADTAALNLREGMQYVFFAQGEQSQWSTDACMGTTPVSDRTLARVEGLLGPPTSFGRAVPKRHPPAHTSVTAPGETADAPGRTSEDATPRSGSQSSNGPGYLVVVLLVAGIVGSFALSAARRRRARSRPSGPWDDGSESLGSGT